MSKIIVPATPLPVYVVEEISAKTSNPYHQVCIDVDESYTIKFFASAEQVELIKLKTATKSEPIV